MFSQLDEMVNQARFSDGYASRMKKLFQGQLNRRRRGQEASLKELRAKVDWLRKKDGRLLDLYSDGEFDRESLKAKRSEFAEQIATLLEKEKALLTVKDEKVLERIVGAIEELRNTPLLYLKSKSLDRKAGHLRKMLLGVRWADGKAEPLWREPYAFLMEDELEAALSAAGRAPAADSAASGNARNTSARETKNSRRIQKAQKNPPRKAKSGDSRRVFGSSSTVRTGDLKREKSDEVQTLVNNIILSFRLWMLSA